MSGDTAIASLQVALTIHVMRRLRLTCHAFYVDLRLSRLNGRWLASADTPDGPSLGWGVTAREALRAALEPFDGMIAELLAATVPVPREGDR